MPKILAVMMSFWVPEMSIQEDKIRFQELKSAGKSGKIYPESMGWWCIGFNISASGSQNLIKLVSF